jgi:hypothetical protein
MGSQRKWARFDLKFDFGLEMGGRQSYWDSECYS